MEVIIYKEFIYIALIPIMPCCFICIISWCCFCYSKFTSKPNLDTPPEYNKLVLDKKNLPKYKDVV